MGIFQRFKSGSDALTPKTPKQGPFAALEIGASKTVCFIIKPEETLTGTAFRVVGVGHQSSKGVRGGAVIDLDAAEEGIRTAVENAESMARTAVSEVTLVTSAGSPCSTRISVEAALSGREVTDKDLRRVIGAGLQEFYAPDRVMLHAMPLGWRVDDHRGVKDPRGMYGRELGVDLHVITAAPDPLRNLANCIERCQLGLAGIVTTPYVSGLGVLAEDEVLLGATVIDMGAQTTSVSVFSENCLFHVDCLPIGGAHVTNDIARGLSTTVHAAERIKVLYGSALDSPDDDRVMIETPPVVSDGSTTMVQQPRALLNSIIRPRLEEIFELIRDRLAAGGVTKAAGNTLILTGGASQLPGTCELASRVLGKQVRTGKPRTINGMGDAVSGPGFSAITGVIARRMRAPTEAISGPPRLEGLDGGRLRAASPEESGTRALLRWFADSF